MYEVERVIIYSFFLKESEKFFEFFNYKSDIFVWRKKINKLIKLFLLFFYIFYKKILICIF